MFSEIGHQITCMDTDPARIERIQGGDVPFYEPGLNELVQAGIAQNTLCFTDDTAEAVEASDYLFICVGTSAAADGSANLQYVMSVAEGIAAHMTSRKVVVNKSTVPVGTADKVAECMAAGLAARGAEISFYAMRTRPMQPETRTPPWPLVPTFQ